MNITVNINAHLTTKNKVYEVIDSDTKYYLIHNDQKRALVLPKNKCTVVNGNDITNRIFYLEDYSNSIRN